MPGQNGGLVTHGFRQTRDRCEGGCHFFSKVGHTESQEQREMVERFICLLKMTEESGRRDCWGQS